MYKAKIIVVAMFVLVTASLLYSQSAELPAAPIAPKVKTTCAECHTAEIILQQRLSKPAWAKEVDKMTKWGALVEPGDRDSFIEYLSTNFSPDKPAYEAPREQRSKK
jgi:hypothetical protein